MQQLKQTQNSVILRLTKKPQQFPLSAQTSSLPVFLFSGYQTYKHKRGTERRQPLVNTPGNRWHENRPPNTGQRTPVHKRKMKKKVLFSLNADTKRQTGWFILRRLCFTCQSIEHMDEPLVDIFVKWKVSRCWQIVISITMCSCFYLGRSLRCQEPKETRSNRKAMASVQFSTSEKVSTFT